MVAPPRPEDKTHAAEALGRRDRRKAETQRRILDAAMQLFERQSYLETTIEQITEAADVGKGTFFNYFSCKEEIVGAFGEMEMERARETADAGLARGDAVRTVLASVFTTLIEVPGRNTNLCRNMIMGHLANVHMREHMSENHRVMGECVIAGLIREGQSRGQVRPELDASLVTHIFFLQLMGVLTLYVFEPKHNLEQLRDAAFDIFWKGIATPPG